MDIEAYLRRIEYYGPREPSASVLRSLHRQHLLTVPFENLDIPLGTPIFLDLPRLYDKIVLHRRGGFCYELNGLFSELLRRLGFSVGILSARVRRDDGGFGPEFDHMLLKVESDGPWLADVGFGESFLHPIPFRQSGADEVEGHRYVVAHADEQWQLLREDGDSQFPLYQFSDVSRQLGDFAAMCHHHQTSPDSHFTQRWICSRATPDGRVTIANMRLIITRGGHREEHMLATEAELRRCLREQLEVEVGDVAAYAKLLAISA